MGTTLKQAFMLDASMNQAPRILVAAVKLPSGAIEVISNTDAIASKIAYYTEKYDDEFKLITNPSVEIVSYMLV